MIKLNTAEIQEYQLLILDQVDRFCAGHGIQYFLDGGTLLGAVRHNGYIPWDDDVDICMMRDEYNRFIQEFNTENTDFHAFSLSSDPKYNLNFCKIAYMKTLLRENNLRDNDCDLGINIDLFPLDHMPERLNGPQILKRLHHLNRIHYCKAHRWETLKTKPIRQQLLILAYKAYGLFTSKHHLGVLQEKIAMQFNEVETPYCTEFTYHYSKDFPRFNVRDYSPVEHVFEDRTYMIPSGYDHILTAMYGDYMQLPPEKDRVAPHNYTAWRLEENE